MARTPDDDDRFIRPNGLTVRRLRHEAGLSQRQLAGAIGDASVIAEGRRLSITPSLLSGIEEQNEKIPYSTLRIIARGLDCDVVDILAQ